MASTLAVDKIKKQSGDTFTLPASDGSSGQFIKTDASGNLAFATAIASVAADTTPQLGGFLDANGNYIQMQKGGDIASATPTVIDTDGDYFICTGTTGFSAFTVAADRHFFLEFSGVLTMTHGAGTLDLPSGANITTAASDVGEFVSTAADEVTCVNYTRASGKALVASHSATIGVQTIWVPAVAMYGVTTNPPDAASVETTAVRPELKVLDFDAGTKQYAQFVIAMPNSWNRSTITFKPYWVPASTNTGNCIWGLQAVSFGDSDPADVAFGTVQTSTDAGIGTLEDIQVGPESAAITVGGTPLDEDITFFQIFRDADDGSDTFSADARLLGIKISFTTDQENDA